MKKLRTLSYIILIGLMCFFIIKSFTTSNDVSGAENEVRTSYNINLVNGNTKAGKLKLEIYNKDSELKETVEEDEEGKISKTNVLSGYYIIINFNLNDNYEIYTWASFNDESYNPIKESQDTSTLYKETSLKQTIRTSDLNIFILGARSTDIVYDIYETSSLEMSSIIGYALKDSDGNIDYSSIKTPIRKGFDFTEFVLKDDTLTGYPQYNSNIWTIFRDYYPLFFKGLGVTLLLAIISIALSLLLGGALCLLRISNNKTLKFISTAYIEVIRGIPSLLLLLLIYCLVGPTKIHIGSFFSTEVLSCILALFLNSSAYTAEIFRSGIQAVDEGQMEAGRALGLSRWKVLKKVVLPQGLKNALPSLGNELVMIIKETSLAYSVNNAIGELMCAKVTVTSVTGNSLAPYIIIAIIYFIVTFSLSRLIMYLEKRFS